jgi:hypothetical protein
MAFRLIWWYRVMSAGSYTNQWDSLRMVRRDMWNCSLSVIWSVPYGCAKHYWLGSQILSTNQGSLWQSSVWVSFHLHGSVKGISGIVTILSWLLPDLAAVSWIAGFVGIALLISGVGYSLPHISAIDLKLCTILKQISWKDLWCIAKSWYKAPRVRA